MQKIMKQVMALLLCAALLCGTAAVPRASALGSGTAAAVDLSSLGPNVVEAQDEETTFVPAGYTYVYENEDGHIYTRQVEQDVYITSRVLTAQEAEALAGLEYGQEGYVVDADGQLLACKEFDAQEAVALSDAVQAILGDVQPVEGEKVSVRHELYARTTSVRVLITFEDAPVIRQEDLSVSLGSGLGAAELQAARKIEEQQLTAVEKIEGALGYDVEVSHQFSLLTNAVAATVNYGDLAAIREMDGVKSAILMPAFSTPEVNSTMAGLDDLKPSMAYAGPGMGANGAWDVGYKGEGMSVAIIDTGISLDNIAFQIEPENSEAVAFAEEDIALILNNYDLQAESIVEGISAEDVYYSSRIPFGFDYAEKRANYGEDDNDAGHGSHVAGIVAGNLPAETQEEFRMGSFGIAPEAQLVVMKVFDGMGQSDLSYILAAMEDAITLGVDSVNLSLGSPCGPVYDDIMTPVFDAAYEAGISVVTSAGNDAHTGVGSLWGDDLVKSDTVSTGTVGMPGSFDSVLTVASVDNDYEFNIYRSYGDHILRWFNAAIEEEEVLVYTDLPGDPVENRFREELKGDRYTITEDFDDAEGKLVFRSFEGGSADGLMQQAVEAKAAGLVLVLSDAAEVTATAFDIPACTVSAEDHQYMIKYISGDRQVLVPDHWNPVATAGQVSDYSSWGPTEGLTIKPEIAAIGGNIFSAWSGTSFAISSGTSMASPAIAASTVLVREYLQGTDLPAGEKLNDVVNRLLTSTATPVFDEAHGTYFFVRRQGAGLVDIGAAINSNAYISVEGSNKAKLEYGDDKDKTGVYEMTFEVVNFSEEAKTYTLDPVVLGQKAEGGRIKNGKITYLTFDYARELDATVTFDLQDNTVTVPANDSREITVTVALSEADKAYYDERFAAGAYVEGFVRLLGSDAETVDLSVPFLAFYGDYDAAPILEEGSYETLMAGEQSYSTADQFHSALWGTEYVQGDDLLSVFQQDHYLGDTNDPFGVKLPQEDYTGAYGTTAFYSEMAGFSPNGDGNLDTFNFGLALRKNADNIHFTVTNRETGELIWEEDTGFMQKTFNASAYAEMSLEWLHPLIVVEYPWGGGFSYYDTETCLLENDTWVEIKAEVTPEGADAPTESKSFTVYVDCDAPVDSAASTFYAELDEWGYYTYWFDFRVAEEWFLDYNISTELYYDEWQGKWDGQVFITTYLSSAEPRRGTSNNGRVGYYSLAGNEKVIEVYADYAGNISAFEILGGENLLDHVDLQADKTQITVGETLTIRDEGTFPLSTVLNWHISDESVAKIVETTDHTITIEGLAPGTVTVSGGYGEYMTSIDILVTHAGDHTVELRDAKPATCEEDGYSGDTYCSVCGELLQQGEVIPATGHTYVNGICTRCGEEDPNHVTLPFTDVPENAWYFQYVYRVYEMGYMQGMTKTTFGPQTTLSRAMVATVLYRIAGSPDVTGTASFSDVPANAWYAREVAWAQSVGVVNGYGDGTFRPEQDVTREEMAAMLARYAEYLGLDITEGAELDDFTDAADVSDWALAAVKWCVANRILLGENHMLLPGEAATRAEFAATVTRFLESKSSTD